MTLDISDPLPVYPLCGDAPYNFVAAGCIYRETARLALSFTPDRGSVLPIRNANSVVVKLARQRFNLEVDHHHFCRLTQLMTISIQLLT